MLGKLGVASAPVLISRLEFSVEANDLQSIQFDASQPCVSEKLPLHACGYVCTMKHRSSHVVDVGNCKLSKMILLWRVACRVFEVNIQLPCCTFGSILQLLVFSSAVALLAGPIAEAARNRMAMTIRFDMSFVRTGIKEVL